MCPLSQPGSFTYQVEYHSQHCLHQRQYLQPLSCSCHQPCVCCICCAWISIRIRQAWEDTAQNIHEKLGLMKLSLACALFCFRFVAVMGSYGLKVAYCQRLPSQDLQKLVEIANLLRPVIACWPVQGAWIPICCLEDQLLIGNPCLTTSCFKHAFCSGFQPQGTARLTLHGIIMKQVCC